MDSVNDGGLTVAIKDGAIVIRLPISILASEAVVPKSLCDSHFNPICRVTDSAAFAGEMVRAMEREAEDGETMLHRLLDEAYVAAFEDGAEGVEDIRL